MRYKAYIDFTSGDINSPEFIEVFPENIENLNISRVDTSKSFDITQYFWRIEFGNVTIKNRPDKFHNTGNEAYRLFDRIHSLDFSQVILFKIVSHNLSTVGYFGRNDCNFDYDMKIVKFTPSTLDRYTDILENWEEDVKIKNLKFDEDKLQVIINNDYLVTKVDWPYTYSFKLPLSNNVITLTDTPRNRVKEKDYNNNGLMTFIDGQKPKMQLFSDSYWGFGGYHNILSTQAQYDYSQYSLDDRISILGEEGTEDLVPEYGDWELSHYRVYEGSRTGGLSGNRWRNLYCNTWFSREEIITVDEYDENDVLIPPPGDGWHQRDARIREGKPAHFWTRRPFNGAYSDAEAWELQPIVLNDNSKDYGYTWYRYIETKLAYDTSNNSIDIYSSLPLRNYIKFLLNNSSSKLANMDVVSTFLFNDYEEELEILKNTVGFNYVSGFSNHLNNLRVIPTWAMRILSPSEEANIPLYTLKETLDDLNKFFANNLCFFITDNNELRIEHIRYMDLKRDIIDVSNGKLLPYTTKWDYDKSSMYERYNITHVNSAYEDFTDNKIEFDSIISNSRNKKQKAAIKTEIFSSDVKFAVYNPNDLEDGLILVVAKNFVVEQYTCPISSQSMPNGIIALSNVLLDFARYESVWHYGKINDVTTDFTTTQRNKVGIEITLQGRLFSMFYITQIGIGIVESCKYDLDEETTKLVLRYRYNSGVNGDTFAIVYQKRNDFNGAENIWADIDNYLVNQ